MKLLVVTQAVDRADPILGFFHRWLEEFAKHFEQMTVIALSVGDYRLPHRVSVHSLGKEKGQRLLRFMRRARYSGNFIRYIVWSRREYDAVFVHMNPEYVILGAPLWRAWRKPIALWYNHTHGGWKLSLAAFLADIVFYTSSHAASARFRNAKRMPAGIDTELFRPQPGIQKHPRSVYFQGRIAPSKNVHVILEAFARLHHAGKAGRLTIVGPDGDRSYARALRKKYADLIASGAVSFQGAVRHDQTPALYAAHTVSVNLTASGGYDKTVLESLASGTPVVLSSKAFADLVPSAWTVPEGDVSALAETITRVLSEAVSPHELHTRVTMRHSLPVLGEKIASELTALRKRS